MRLRTQLSVVAIFVFGIAIYLQQTRIDRSARAEAAPEVLGTATTTMIADDPVALAIAHRATLDPMERHEAEMEAGAASVELYSARAQAPLSVANIAQNEDREASAERRWESAMARLYGPTWRSYHRATIDQAVEGYSARHR